MGRKVGLLLFLGLLWAVPAAADVASDIFEAVSPSVVVIHALDAKGNQVSLGSGVALSAEEVVTNCHVLEDGTGYRVVYRSTTYPAELRHSDWDRDVCSLAVSDLGAKPATLGATGKLRVGQKVYAVGAPQGLDLSLSDGIVASLRPVEGGQYLQITAPISPGSSGGGLFDGDGRLIGLPTFYLTEGQQLNFAVPVEWIKELPKRQQVAKSGQTTYTDWLNKAMALQQLNDWSGLRKHALTWTRANPRVSQAWFALGLAYGKSGQTNKAIEAFQQVIKIDPEFAGAWNNLGLAYNQSGQTAKAIEALQQAIRIDPEGAGAWYNLGNAYDRSGQTAKKIEAYQQALRVDPENASAWNNLGVAYGQSGQTAKAIEALQQAIRIDPENAGAWYNLGFAHSIAGQRGKVMEVYRQLKSIDPGLADEFFNEIVLP